MSNSAMDHKAFKIFDAEDFVRLTSGLKLAQCMRSDTAVELAIPSDAESTLRGLEDLIVSDRLFCSYCKCGFEDQTQQRQHYKLDWHRYNLKRGIAGKRQVTEDNFSTLADDDDVSSISGSESESESDSELGSTDAESQATTRVNVDARQKKVNAVMAWRHAKVFFENDKGKILSLYRCLMHGKKEAPEKDDEYTNLAKQTVNKTKWAIMMLGGGHFAGGIFDGREVLAHKTFHCYTVRKGQGGSQSTKDNRSGSSHPKSAGASLRRYNEAALIQHVQDLLATWSDQLATCDLVFYRASGHNTSVLFGGRNPPLSKTDSRLRTVPFPTRRATFSEVKRVQDMLATIEVYGAASDYQLAFPQSPRKKISKPVDSDNANSTESSSVDNLPLISETTAEESPESNQRNPRQRLNRAKSREMPERPLPNIVNELAMSSLESSDKSDDESFMVHDDFETNFTRDLLDHEDTVPQHVKDRRKKKRFPKVKKPKVDDKIVERAEVVALRKKLVTACTSGDIALLTLTIESVNTCLTKCEDSEIVPLTSAVEDNIANGDNRMNQLTRDDLLACLNEQVDEKGNRVLHLAARNGHLDIIRQLMESGADPCIKNKSSQPPYAVSPNKDTRNAFRRFVAEFPDKYDYTKSQIPGGLTDEMQQEQAERKRAMKKAKLKRGKEKKKEEEEKKEETLEKERFLKLSDREKRALAAERRMVTSAVHGGVSAPVVARCFLCAVDISGRVPFQYDINRFCSIECLKAHRMSSKTTL